MLRIHFTAEDFARIQIAPEPDRLWESVLGLQQLNCTGRVPYRYRHWHRRSCEEVDRRDLSKLLRLLGVLVPSTGYVPDFLTPDSAAPGLNSGLESIRTTPPERIRSELSRLASARRRSGAVSVWIHDLARGDRERMAELVQALRTAHDTLIAPEWDRIHALTENDRAIRARGLRDGGVHRLLASLGPGIQWQPPVLSTAYPVDRDLYLAGRGLLLIPSYFCHRIPISLADGNLRPVLVYPVDHGAVGDATAGPANLNALLGHTRARTLSALREGATTGELARRLQISPASASQHVHVLAGAQLVHSRRTGGSVLHTLTPLGTALLRGHLSGRAADVGVSGSAEIHGAAAALGSTVLSGARGRPQTARPENGSASERSHCNPGRRAREL